MNSFTLSSLKSMAGFCLAFCFTSILWAQNPTVENGFTIPIQVSGAPVSQTDIAPPPQSGSVAFKSVDPVLSQLLQVKLDEVTTLNNRVGVSAAVKLPNGDIWTGTSGQSAANTPIQPEEVFGIGSTTKTFTAACIMEMMEEGKLSLDDSIGKWLAPSPNVNVNTITVKQCLQHTSGIYNYTNNPRFADSLNVNLNRIWTPQEMLDYFVDAPDFAPGTSWNYSNTNFVLLGLIIESISGQTYHQEIRDRFITPLGLTSMFLDPQEMLPPFRQKVHLWADFDGNMVLEDVTAQGFGLAALFSAAWAAGSYYSDAADMAEWAWQLYGGNLLDPQTLQEMVDFFPVNSSFAYGLGTIRSTYAGLEGHGHGGDIIFGGQVYYFPDAEVSVVAQTNDGFSTSAGMNPVIDSLLISYVRWRDSQPSTTIDETQLIPSVSLFPSPFSDHLALSFELDESASVSFSLINGLGQQVARYDLGNFPAGEQTISLEGSRIHSLSNGIYFYHLQAGNRVSSGKIIKK